ncbi:hypothetical protein [Herbaspirillum autotrophicum]|uniref:hypothetical protein n=1 Tax=Herbaspirillum autotrophicum TaxID=180195 RepID=UPI00067DA9AA|nr:hypothetical protein [Herbaspirillum autotrophicum]
MNSAPDLSADGRRFWAPGAAGDVALRRWLFLPAIDADASWLRNGEPPAGRRMLRQASAALFCENKVCLPWLPVDTSVIRWLMQPQSAIERSLCLLSALLLREKVLLNVAGPQHDALVQRIGWDGMQTVASHAGSADQSRTLLQIGLPPPDWCQRQSAAWPGMALMAATLSAMDPGLVSRFLLRLPRDWQSAQYRVLQAQLNDSPWCQVAADIAMIRSDMQGRQDDHFAIR